MLATKDSAATFSSAGAPGALELEPPLPPKVDTLRLRVPPDDPVSFTFRSRFPLRLRSFPVVSLGFITTEREQPRSAATGGIVQRRIYDDGSEGRRLHRGDLLTLGPVQGRLKELAIESTGQEVAAVTAAGNLTEISTLFEGLAEAPAVAGFDLRPSWLEFLLHSEQWQAFLAVVGTVTGVVIMALQLLHDP